MDARRVPLSKASSILRLKEKVERRLRLTNTFWNDVWESLNHTGTLESEVQLFLDENPDAKELKNLPQCPFLEEFLRYCSNPLFKPPLVRTPKRAEIAAGIYSGRVTYNKIMLGLAATFMILPCYQRNSYQSYLSIPSPDLKKDQILRLSVALVHSQNQFIGSYNESCFMGLDFISLVANAYGVKLFFYNPGEGGAPSDPSPSLRKAKKFIKNDRHHRKENELMANLRQFPSALEDLSSRILELPWSQVEKNKGTRMTIRDGLTLSLKGIRPQNWFSLVENLDYYSDHWMTSCDLSEFDQFPSSEEDLILP